MARTIERSSLCWLALLAFTLICLGLQARFPWIAAYPESWVVPLTDILNRWMIWFVEKAGWVFRAISVALEWPVRGVQQLLGWLPWPVIVVVTAVLAHRAAGWPLVVFSVLSLMYMLVVGYWPESMNSLALVIISVPMAIGLGFAIGVWGFFSPRAERFIMPTLDLLQTVPAFAYLLPILLLFGFGPVVGLIASVLYSFPPMVRNTILGLRRVPGEVVESGMMSGATPRQLFWQVQLPNASRQILLGANQATMASLSMVIIASIIGGTADIGWEVLSTLRKALFGESLLAGIVIALLAMVMDRITAGLATRETSGSSDTPSLMRRHGHLILAIVAIACVSVASRLSPVFHTFPEEWVYYPAKAMNDWLEYFVVEYQAVIETVKNWSFFYVMLPARIGLQQTISPYSWGFELTTSHIVLYAVAAAAAAATAAWRWGVTSGVAVAFFAVILFFGLTRIPWPALVAIATFLGWRLGGVRLAAGTAMGLGFLLVTGMWEPAMRSVYLCGLAVAISFGVGACIGVFAAHNDRASAFIRPINDTLQTMPLFVILIPFVMIFKIGEFTALLAICAYAVVPAIRYTEHGLRHLPQDVLEAATAMGCTKSQSLFQVKLPLAMPVMMLGLNQTIMYSIAMLVIAALVGTNGLGQQVYIGLGDGDFGVGFVAGLGMAIIAMIADRMTQAYSHSRRDAFGLSA